MMDGLIKTNGSILPTSRGNGSTSRSSFASKAVGTAIGVGAVGMGAMTAYNMLSDEEETNNVVPTSTSVPSVADAVGGTVGGGSVVQKPLNANTGSSPSNNSSRGNALVFPRTLSNIALNPASINFQFFNRDTKEKTTSIYLQMPDNINNPSTISWDTEDFGMVGEAVVKSLQNMSGGGDNHGQQVESTILSMGERIKSLAFYNAVSYGVGKAGGSASAGGIMSRVSNKTSNPYKAYIFRGVDFRTFSFDFTLAPFSESDCDIIDSIVRKFREHSYPDYANDKMFFTLPDECQITYMWETGHNKWLNAFKRAVCTGIDVQYNSGQWTSLRNGFPTLIRISTRWTETELVTKQDIIKRNSNGQTL